MGALETLLAWREKNRPPEQFREQAPRERRKFVIGGRAFAEIDFDRRTVLIDHYIMRIIRGHGIDRIMPADAESPNAYLVRMQTAVIDTGRAHELLAAYLLPVGKNARDWSPEMAKDTAAHIGHCDTDADRELVLQLCTEVVFAFFVHGVERLMPSLAYLTAMGAAESTPPQVTHPTPTTENGPSSFDTSHASTSSDTRRSRRGRFKKFLGRFSSK